MEFYLTEMFDDLTKTSQLEETDLEQETTANTSTEESSAIQGELKRLRNEHADLQHKYDRISKSYSYKIGHALLKGPYQVVKRVRKYKRRKQNQFLLS